MNQNDLSTPTQSCDWARLTIFISEGNSKSSGYLTSLCWVRNIHVRIGLHTQCLPYETIFMQHLFALQLSFG
ncbi:unnamed protein product [Allacma fusca]|uniref:Uncharacterized protein n=1 Tax=Allacma fusca TaxID=39272 RepID=A0A8J2NPN7_9HEXA|nr:unnamed protein product [Allacma fusca]